MACRPRSGVVKKRLAESGDQVKLWDLRNGRAPRVFRGHAGPVHSVAFLPDGRMLITEKGGPVWLVSQSGEKIQVENTPKVYFQGQNGMMGVFLSPHYATDRSIYLTYVEPGDYGGGYALARAKLNATNTSASLENFQVLWHQVPTGKGGQAGGPIAFSADGKYLFLAVGDRQRFTPAQDPDQPLIPVTPAQPSAVGFGDLRCEQRPAILDPVVLVAAPGRQKADAQAQLVGPNHDEVHVVPVIVVRTVLHVRPRRVEVLDIVTDQVGEDLVQRRRVAPGRRHGLHHHPRAA